MIILIIRVVLIKVKYGISTRLYSSIYFYEHNLNITSTMFSLGIITPIFKWSHWIKAHREWFTLQGSGLIFLAPSPMFFLSVIKPQISCLHPDFITTLHPYLHDWDLKEAPVVSLLSNFPTYEDRANCWPHHREDSLQTFNSKTGARHFTTLSHLVLLFTL